MEIKRVKLCVFWFQICAQLCSRVKAEMSAFIVGGVGVSASMYPHVAQIALEGDHLCGGSIISDRVVLSAAHCVDFPEYGVLSADKLAVYLGASKSMKGEKYKVCRVVTHPKYDWAGLTTYYYYDLSLFLLCDRIRFGRTVQKIQISPTRKWMNSKYRVTVTGFGLVRSPVGPLSRNLKATKMRFVPRAVCNASHPDGGGEMPVPEHMFCMIGQKWTSDCSGDSGSGVIWRGYLVGTVTIGRENSCGSDMKPSMYTDVAYFKHWIVETTRSLEKTPRTASDVRREKRKQRQNKKRKLLVLRPLSIKKL